MGVLLQRGQKPASVDHQPTSSAYVKRSRFQSPHRVASWSLAAFTLFALVSASLLWTSLLSGRWTILSATASLTMFVVLFTQGHFRVNMDEGGRIKLRASVGAAAFGISAAMIVVSVPALGQPDIEAFASLLVSLTAAGILARLIGRWLLERAWRNGNLRAAALVFGDDALTREMAVEIGLRPERGVDIVGFVSVDPNRRHRRLSNLPVFPLDPASDRESLAIQMADAAQRARANRVIIGPGAGAEHLAQAAARWAANEGMPVHVVPRFHEMGMGLDSAMSPDTVRGFPLVRLQRAAHPTLSRKIKRLLDIAVSGTVLILLSPLLAAAAVAVRLSSPGDILFAQERVGQHGRSIMVRKFRSMTVSDASDTEWNAEARVTKVGSFLRRSNIDELPQLYSILVGDMSLVGPRPERPAFVKQFSAEVPNYDDRHRMPVGLTGLAQVVGLRGDTSIAERIKYDNLYIDQWSLRSDLEILLRTVTAVLFQRKLSEQMIELDKAVGSVHKELDREAAEASGTPAVEQQVAPVGG
jgi:exopolysaccharide biosynthesis polyprenyl glycosylphosphotransferase